MSRVSPNMNDPVLSNISIPSPFGDVAGYWGLDPGITFLNHGSFGATPTEVLEAQSRYRARIEGRPIEMLGRRVAELLEPARVAVAELIGAPPESVGFVTNATEAINGILNSLRFEAGDELLTTNHVYGAVRQAMRFSARRWGAKVVEAAVDVPVESPRAVVEAIERSVTPRTKLAVIDHVTSPTALVFPIGEIVRRLQSRGVVVLVDGAHGPGMREVDVEAIGAEYYTANLHKWICAPKGCGFIWAREDVRNEVHPAVISHRLGDGFEAEFGWQGTRDITAWMCAADAIAFWKRMGFERMMEHNHRLATWAHAMLCDAWGSRPISPRDGSMLGSMATVEAPAHLRRFEKWELAQKHLYEQHRIEVPFVDWAGSWWIRVSAQVYNRAEEYERLAEAVAGM